MKISDFNNILLYIMKYYIDQISIEIIESMTYKFFLDLIVISEENASEYIMKFYIKSKFKYNSYNIILKHKS